MGSLVLAGVSFKHSLSESSVSDAVKLIETSRTARKKKLVELRQAIQSKNDAAEMELRSCLTTDAVALIASAVKANSKLRASKRMSLETCLSSPSKIDLKKPIDELVAVRPKEKKSGGHRMLHNHGPLHRTAQYAINDVLAVYFKPKAFQYTHSGIQQAVRQIKKAVGDGHQFVAHLDIRDFFPSFSADALTEILPLQEGAVVHAVSGRHMKVVLDQESKEGLHALSLPQTHEHLLTLARLGIPLGSASSPIVGMFCVSKISWAPIPGVIVVNYADDFLLLASSEALREQAIGKLTEAVKNCPGGQFVLKTKAISTASKGFEFLGHQYRRLDNSFHIKPAEANLQHAYRTLDEIEARLGSLTNGFSKKHPATVPLLAAYASYLKGWLATFIECDNLARWAAAFWEGLLSMMKAAGVSWDEVSHAFEPWMAYRPSEYALGH